MINSLFYRVITNYRQLKRLFGNKLIGPSQKTDKEVGSLASELTMTGWRDGLSASRVGEACQTRHWTGQNNWFRLLRGGQDPRTRSEGPSCRQWIARAPGSALTFWPAHKHPPFVQWPICIAKHYSWSLNTNTPIFHHRLCDILVCFPGFHVHEPKQQSELTFYDQLIEEAAKSDFTSL